MVKVNIIGISRGDSIFFGWVMREGILFLGFFYLKFMILVLS